MLGSGVTAGMLRRSSHCPTKLSTRAEDRGVGEHPPHLPFERRGVAQLAPDRRVEQRVVGNAAPQEERQPRRQGEVAHRIGGAGRGVDGVALDPEQELGIGEQALQGELDARLEAVGLSPPLVEPEQHVDVAVGDRAPVGAPGQPPQDLARTRLGRVTPVGMTREDAAAARGVAGAVHRVRPADLHAVDRRVPLPALVDGEGEAGLAGLQDPFRLPVPALERDADHPLARLGVEPHLEVLVGPEHVGLPVGMPEERGVPGEARRGGGGVGRRPAPDREPGHEPAVDPHVEVLRGAEAADVVGVGALEAQPDGVLAVHGKAVSHRDAAARPEREVLAQPVVLVQQEGDSVRLDARHRRRQPHREPADLARCRQIPLEEGRRDRQHRRHVVEAVLVGVVGGQEGRDVDLDLEQVAHRVAVLGPVQAVERLGAAHPRIGGGGPVERRLEEPTRARASPRSGRGPPGGRHRADPQLADHVLPDDRIARDVGQVRRVEREPRGAQPRVVADDAVAVEHRPVRRGVVGRLGARGGDAEGRGQNAGEDGRGGRASGRGGKTGCHVNLRPYASASPMVPDDSGVVNGRGHQGAGGVVKGRGPR